MTPEGQAHLDELLTEAARDGLFPQARAVVRSGGTVVYDGGIAAGPATVFDLASLTKVLGTTAAFLVLWADGRVAPGTPIRDLLPDARVAQAGVTLGDLLGHRSGLPAFVPYFADALRETPALLDPACRVDVRVAARRRVVARALATPLATAPGQEAVYSDVGFILLGEALAAAARRPLDALVQGRVIAPLSLGCHFRRPAAPGLSLIHI